MGNYRAESATSAPSRTVEQILLKTMVMHKENNEVNGNIQHSFLKHKSCLANVVAFPDRIRDEWWMREEQLTSSS